MDSKIPSIGADPPEPIDPWLWPALGISAIAVVLNGAAWLGLRLAPLLPWAAAGCLLAAAYSVALLARNRSGVVGVVLAAIASALVICDAAQTFWPAHYISAHPDAWSYDTVAGYLTDYGRSRTAGMPLTDQFASHLRNSRFSSSCLLALSDYAWGAAGRFHAHEFFYFVCLFVTFGSMTAFARELGLDLLWAHAAAGGAQLFGWSANAIIIGNYDNLCFAALLPAALALYLHLARGNFGWKTVLLLGLTIASILYTYPEGVALCGLAILPVVVVTLAQAKQRVRIVIRLLAAAALGAVLWIPFAPFFLRFLSHQMTVGTSAAGRPGVGNFTGLLSPRLLPSVFALGSEYPTSVDRWWSTPLAAVLIVVLLLGTWRLAGRHRWLILSLGAAALLLFWEVHTKQYDYGAYKVLYCHFWLVAPPMAASGAYIWRTLPRAAAIAILAGLILGTAGTRWSHRGERVWPQTSDLAALADLTTIKPIVNRAPVVLMVRGNFDQMWALSMLRGLPIIVADRRGYLAMPHVQPALGLAQTVPATVPEFYLGDRPLANSAWQNSRFAMTRNIGVYLSAVENPNGTETVNGKPFLWIGHSQECILHVHAREAGVYSVGAIEWWPGPSLQGSAQRTIMVVDAEGKHSEALDFSSPRILLHLKEGENTVHLAVEERPNLLLQPNGDHRELMLGMLGYSLEHVNSK